MSQQKHKLFLLLLLPALLAGCGSNASPNQDQTGTAVSAATGRPATGAGGAPTLTASTTPVPTARVAETVTLPATTNHQPTQPSADTSPTSVVEQAPTGAATTTSAPTTAATELPTTAASQPPTMAPNQPQATATAEPLAARPTTTAKAVGAPQIRALWVDAFNSGFHTSAEVRQLISDARRGNINTLVVQIRRRGDAFYRSSIEPAAETADEDVPVPANFDPLQAIIEEAHAHGIEVHAWIASLPVWHWDTKFQTTNPQHVWHRHGPSASGHDNWVMMKLNDDGSLSPTYSLDPGHPDAAQYTIDVSLDIIRNYDVDGLHLDYIRYGGKNEGYNALAVERFNALYGRSGLPEPTDPDWMQWRRDQVTALVRRLYIESYRIKPHVKLSAATITWGAGPTEEADWTRTAAYASVLQDWRAWTEEGILDLAMPMNYFREYIGSERDAFDQWIEWEKNHQYGRQVLAGPGVFFNYIEDSLAQIRRALAPSSTGGKVPGVSLYSYAATNIYSNVDYRKSREAQSRLPRSWADRPGLNSTFFSALSEPSSYTYTHQNQRTTVSTEPVFTAPAPIPPMPWKDSPTRGYLFGNIVPAEEVSRADVDGLEVALVGPELRTLRTDGNGWFGAVGLPPGNYQATLSDRWGRRYEADVTVRAGAVEQLEFEVQPRSGN